MIFEYVEFSMDVDHGKTVDEDGNYLPFPTDDDVYPLFEKYAKQIDKVILICNKRFGISRKEVVKKFNRIHINYDIIELEEFDFTDKKQGRFIFLCDGESNDLSLFYQSSNYDLLREFSDLFKRPYREDCLAQDDLFLKKEIDANNLQSIISNLEEDSYLISSRFEGQSYYIFGHAKILEMINSWG